MATETEIKALYLDLLDAYPAFEPRSDHPWESWTRFFAGEDIQTLRQAVELHIGQSRFFPSIAEINALLKTAGQQRLEVEYRQALPGPIAIERQRLENMVHETGVFDKAMWTALLQKAETAGLENTALHLRYRIARHQEHVLC